MNLYIIGNGFDLAHGFRTTYLDFRDFLEENHDFFLRQLEELYGFSPFSNRASLEKYLWREFEYNLSLFNEHNMIENAQAMDMNLESGDVGVLDTLDIHWEDQYGFISELNTYLYDWIKQVNISSCKKTDKFNSGLKNRYFSFNYTLVLENLYGINSNEICHIHGSVDENNFPPVIGHGNLEKISYYKEKIEEAQSIFDEKSESIYGAVKTYCERSLKDVNHCISRESIFFEGLNTVKAVYIVGTSFGEVDMPYFDLVSRVINKNAMWNIYYYDEDVKDEYKMKIIGMGISENQINIEHVSSFFS